MTVPAGDTDQEGAPGIAERVADDKSAALVPTEPATGATNEQLPASEIAKARLLDGGHPEPMGHPSSSEPVADLKPSEPMRPWERLPDGRVVVGDAGRLTQLTALPSPVLSRADIEATGAVHGQLCYRAATLRGASHLALRAPRQDAYSFRFSTTGDWLAICVADGVSQSPASHTAADLACRKLTRALASSLDSSPIPETFEDWKQLSESIDWAGAAESASAAIIDAATGLAKPTDAAESGDQVRSLSSTEAAAVMATTAVCLVIATRTNADGALPYSVAIVAGDSPAMLLTGGRWSALTELKDTDPEIASSAVHPLPRQPSIQPQLGALEKGQALVLMTDGLGDPLGAGSGQVGSFLAERWQEPPDTLSFLIDLGFLRKTFVDDRTAFAVWSLAD